MKCQKCGIKVSGNAAFCPNCGAKIVASNDQKEMHGDKIRDRNRLRITILFCATIIVVLVLIAMSIPRRMYEKAHYYDYHTHEYQKAISIYKKLEAIGYKDKAGNTMPHLIKMSYRELAFQNSAKDLKYLDQKCTSGLFTFSYTNTVYSYDPEMPDGVEKTGFGVGGEFYPTNEEAVDDLKLIFNRLELEESTLDDILNNSDEFTKYSVTDGNYSIEWEQYYGSISLDIRMLFDSNSIEY